ncbi:MAG: KH domain-containing protein [Actinobacteria bacterium]|uniref:Unannotated protein n=1 Tax=freshwater metagenome TaxID=449393 RepID=A0A6J7EFJ3_9ZZZZ|nr:KH domain-containing protein [Actinomycetota bacterium]MSY12332.1 KH domain-containing protein [Actinomycetota bacterium]MSZ03788.1 KH domain-containing protein [Actinomycetota bacterium]MTB05521.1 KH domain-containing protein [Actinomycetota bacterium]
MEWVETTAKTIEEAKELALDQLGVAVDDAEFEVLEEPRPGLFGRTRGEARVRARVRPTKPRPKVERRDRRRKGADKPDQTDDAAVAADVDTEAVEAPAPTPKPRAAKTAARKPAKKTEEPVNDANNTPTVEAVAAEAEKFIHGLLGALGLEGTTAVRHDGEDIEVDVDGENLGVLIGPRGTTLLAVQDLVRVAAQRRIGDHTTRLRLDISGYREKRQAALARFAMEQADEVASTGEERGLEPMPSADRKVIHDALSIRTDVETRSEGEDPRRRVVIAPASSAN